MTAYQTPQEWLTQLESQSPPPQPSLMNTLTRYGLARNEQTARYILFGASIVLIIVGWFLWYMIHPAPNQWTTETKRDIQADIEQMQRLGR